MALVRRPRDARATLTINKDCIVPGCHDGANFSVTKTPAQLNFKTRLANPQKTMKMVKFKD